MKKISALIGIGFTFFSQIVFADITGDLNHFFNHLGFSQNVTSAQAYQGQQAGYYTGGSLYARDSVRDVQIAQIDLPSFRSGCGGIDLFTGGFSFVNSQELINTMRNIMNNAAGYAFNLALESATPEIANSMKYFNTLAANVNQFTINSCETAAGLVGTMWPRTQVAQQHVCQAIGAGNGLFSDYAAARQGCSAGGQMTSTLTSAQGPYKNLVFNNVNMAWKTLQQNSFLQHDLQLAEFFMSLSGTVILSNAGNSDNAGQQYKVLASLASDQSLLKALLQGGRARIYHCDDTSPDGCLNPTIQIVTIAEQEALGVQVKNLLNDMVDKMLADQPLTPAEIGLLNATHLPVYKMLNVQVAYAGNKAMLDSASYADFIATDILFQYLDENLSLIRTQSASLQYPDALLSEFMQSINQARARVSDAKKSAYSQLATAAQLIQQTQVLEQMLAGSLSAQLSSSLSWANNLRQ